MGNGRGESPLLSFPDAQDGFASLNPSHLWEG